MRSLGMDSPALRPTPFWEEREGAHSKYGVQAILMSVIVSPFFFCIVTPFSFLHVLQRDQRERAVSLFLFVRRRFEASTGLIGFYGGVSLLL